VLNGSVNNDGLNKMLIAHSDGYLVNTTVNMTGQLYRMGGMEIGVI
jgi:hypothetical protein